jgi:hypothetical protein
VVGGEGKEEGGVCAHEECRGEGGGGGPGLVCMGAAVTYMSTAKRKHEKQLLTHTNAYIQDACTRHRGYFSCGGGQGQSLHVPVTASSTTFTFSVAVPQRT